MSKSIGQVFASFDFSGEGAEISNLGVINLADPRNSDVCVGHGHVCMQTQWNEMPGPQAVTDFNASGNKHYHETKRASDLQSPHHIQLDDLISQNVPE